MYSKYYEWKKYNKYCDLRLIIEDKELFLHKSLVCESFDFINMLYKRECELSENTCPPIHTIRFGLPDDISIEDIESAIDFFVIISS